MEAIEVSDDAGPVHQDGMGLRAVPDLPPLLVRVDIEPANSVLRGHDDRGIVDSGRNGSILPPDGPPPDLRTGEIVDRKRPGPQSIHPVVGDGRGGHVCQSIVRPRDGPVRAVEDDQPLLGPHVDVPLGAYRRGNSVGLVLGDRVFVRR